MANELLSFSTILREAMDIFENNCVAAKCVNRRYENKLADFGESFYVPIPETPTVSDGPTLDLKDTAPEKVLVTVDKQKHTDFTFTSKERSLNIDQFSDLFLKPRMEALANQVDRDILAMTKNASMLVGTWGSDPASMVPLLQASQYLTEQSAPMDNRHLFLSPAHKASLISTSSTGLIHLANPGSPAGEMYRKGQLGMVAGFDSYESVNTYTHTVGSDITVGNTAANFTTEGQTTIVATGAGTLAVGDVFTIADCYAVNPVTKQTLPTLRQFVVTDASSASTTITFAPAVYSTGSKKNVSTFTVTGKAITFVGTASEVGGNSVFFHRDAFGLVTADLVVPDGVDTGARRNHKGISMRLVRDYDIVNDRFPCRIDILYGTVAYRPHTHAVRLVGRDANT